MILSLDPGIRGSGAARFLNDGELAVAGYVRNPVKKGHGIAEALTMAKAAVYWARNGPRGWLLPFDRVVVERMKVYPDRRTPGDPNVSLLPLVGVAYMVAALLAEPITQAHEFEAPRDWKGTIDGIEVTRRVRERLTPAEFARVELPPSACAECRAHHGAYCAKGEKGCGADHVYDAIGIGLKHLGRFERRRIFAR